MIVKEVMTGDVSPVAMFIQLVVCDQPAGHFKVILGKSRGMRFGKSQSFLHFVEIWDEGGIVPRWVPNSLKNLVCYKNGIS